MTEKEFSEAPVSFQTFIGHRDPLRLGKGKVAIEGDTVNITGRRRKLLAVRKQQESIQLDDIYNVMVENRSVRFNVRQQHYKQPRLLQFRKQALAEAFAAQLPQQRTAELDRAIKDAARFQDFMQTAPQPWANSAIIITCILAYIASAISGNSWFDINPSALIQYGGNYAPATTNGEWWRLLTAVFLHGGFIHIAMNMAVLWDSGRMLEKLIGHARYLLLYLSAGIAGSLASINWQQEAASVGASGAIFGVYGALTIGLVTHRNLLPKNITLRLRNNGIFFIIYVLAYGAMKPGIDNAAHLGGLAAGVLIGAFMLAPAHKLALAYAALIAVLGFSSERAITVAQPYQDEMAYHAFFQQFKNEESRLENQLQQLAPLLKANKKQQALDLLQNDIIPGWRKLDTSIMAINRVTKDSQKTRDLIAEIIHLKRQSMELIAQSIRNEDEELITEANAKLARIQQLIQRYTTEQRTRQNQLDKNADTGG